MGGQIIFSDFLVIDSHYFFKSLKSITTGGMLGKKKQDDIFEGV